MTAPVQGLVAELRSVGIPVSTTEVTDAVRALASVDLLDRGQIRTALRTTLIKNGDHIAAFDAVFELFFHRADESRVGPDGDDGGNPFADLADGALRATLVDALRRDDRVTSGLVAETLIDRHGGVEPGRPVAGALYLLRVLRAVDLDAVAADLSRTGAEVAGPGADLLRRLAADAAGHSVTTFRQDVEFRIRRRLAADRGAEAVAATVRTPLAEDIDLLHASLADLDAIRSIVQPLGRALAARLAIRRGRRRHGRLDVRRTVRRALSTGGTLMSPAYRPPRPRKPRLFVLADISGSVSAFAAFTLQLLIVLRREFASVRTYVFVDGIDDVTGVLAETDDVVDAARTLDADRSGIWLDGRSDYGNALQTWWNRYGDVLDRRSTVIVLGDARSNDRAPRADVLGAIRKRAGHVYWLNPEPRGAWDEGDSVISQYAPHCDAVVECRTARQLRAFVEQLA